MHAFTTHTGLVLALNRVNVDTDQMIPKQFLKGLTREGYGRWLFYDWRYLPGEKPNPDFELNFPRYKGSSILLAGANFGCGSSREHAPWGILDYGFHVVIAPSYADIFYNNCFKNGILPVTLSQEEVDELFKRTEHNVGYQLTVDLPAQTISDAQGLKYSFLTAARGSWSGFWGSRASSSAARQCASYRAGYPRGKDDPRAAGEASLAGICAKCHVKIDPPGFALENYDPAGRGATVTRSSSRGGRRRG